MQQKRFRTIDGAFEIKKSAILAVIKFTETRPVMKPHSDVKLAQKGEMIESGQVMKRRRIKIMISSTPITLSSDHSREFELFLVREWPKVEAWVADPADIPEDAEPAMQLVKANA